MRAYLDDVRPRPSNFDIIWRSVAEAQTYCVDNGVPLYISFDHDMGLDKDSFEIAPTGMDFCKWLVNMDMALNFEFIPACFDFASHSGNPIGARNIESYLEQYLRQRQEKYEY